MHQQHWHFWNVSTLIFKLGFIIVTIFWILIINKNKTLFWHDGVRIGFTNTDYKVIRARNISLISFSWWFLIYSILMNAANFQHWFILTIKGAKLQQPLSFLWSKNVIHSDFVKFDSVITLRCHYLVLNLMNKNVRKV